MSLVMILLLFSYALLLKSSVDCSLLRSVYLSFASLLSALSLLTLACLLHIFAGKHTAIVCLQELGSLVKCIHFFLLLLLFLPHDELKGFSLAALLNAFIPLFFDLRKLVFLVLKVGLGIITLLVLLAHVVIVRVKRLSVLLISTIEGNGLLLFTD